MIDTPTESRDMATRRREGEFYTPTLYVDKAHEYMDEVLGADWREKYIVFDPAWGTGNLTRDYRFTELYASTLHQSDIDTANQMGYNPNATKFQFDFLNDPDEKLPEGLLKALRGERDKEVVILMNPPYGNGASRLDMGDVSGSQKDMSRTIVREQMRAEKIWGKCTRQLYAQFVWRLRTYPAFQSMHIGWFSSPLWVTGPSFAKFRKELSRTKHLARGFVLPASEFADVANTWGILFSILIPRNNQQGLECRAGITQTDVNRVVTSGYKYLYNTDHKKSADSWIKEASGTYAFTDFPKLSSFAKVKETKHGRGVVTGSLGNFVNHANNIYANTGEVYFLTGGVTSNLAVVPVFPENLDRCVSLFTARRSIKNTWINDKDEYLAPNEDHPAYPQFVSDAFIYALFNPSSQQSSLRNIEYKGKLYDIENEFFWMSKDGLMELAEEYHFDELYQDAKYRNDRHYRSVLETLTSGDHDKYPAPTETALNVLWAADALMIKAFPLRQMYHESNPHLHLHAWDAGWAQHKPLFRDLLKEEYDEFRALYKELEESLIPKVYEVGFLLDQRSFQQK